MTREVSDLKEQLFKAEERIAELQASNVELNTTRDEAIASRTPLKRSSSTIGRKGLKRISSTTSRVPLSIMRR